MSYQRVLLIAAVTGALITAATQVAAQPPINQQAQIVAWVNDNHGWLVLLRRGHYNAVADQGFGFDKAVHKHNLTDSTIITAVVHDPGASGVGVPVRIVLGRRLTGPLENS
ncbi:hypothetical protein K7711_46910 [Nocardia sp. CA2R105]|uniref:hypothetical protein n=1 Tax=Nocardia coffeae TaxID=2873381 RepID=UPI001CA64083|nr:hypothetical protein [Nocardia coffeae]MBY8864061.1 hypothetical protein [Nocardia coffeae]